MKFVIADKTKKYALLDIIPAPDALLINSLEVLEPDLFHILPEDSIDAQKIRVENWLDRRVFRECSHAFDAYALNELELMPMKAHFGRMDEFSWALGFIKYFEKDDGITMRPIHSQCLSFAYFGYEWCQLYYLEGYDQWITEH